MQVQHKRQHKKLYSFLILTSWVLSVLGKNEWKYFKAAWIRETAKSVCGEEIMKKKKCPPHGNIYVSSIFEMNDNSKQREKRKKKKKICDLIKITQSSYWDLAFQGVQNGHFRKALQLTDFLVGHENIGFCHQSQALICQLVLVLSGCLWSWSVMKNRTRKYVENSFTHFKGFL